MSVSTESTAPSHQGKAALSPRQAARLLNYDLQYLYKLIWAGRLPAEKIDGQWQISAAAIDARLARVSM